MGHIRAVGFDLDGTLFDHRGSAARGVDEFVRGLGVDPSDHIRTLWFAAEDAGYAQWSSGRLTFQEQRRSRLRAVLPDVGVDFDTTDAALDELLVGGKRRPPMSDGLCSRAGSFGAAVGETTRHRAARRIASSTPQR